LSNVFGSFLPQPLLYLNPFDPLNGEIASLLMHDANLYGQKVKEYCAKYAKAEGAGSKEDDGSNNYEFSEDEYSSSL
ncbi:hypothetical protein KI387_025906, partial [Taxus chinensis]